MSQIVLSQIEQNIRQLPVDEQLCLSRGSRKGYAKKVETQTGFENQLLEMAKDANIQRELKEIEQDFRRTELDGLEQ